MIEIEIRRYRLTSDLRPGWWVWAYDYRTPVDIGWTAADGSTRPGPRAGEWVDYGPGIADLRGMLRSKYGTKIMILELWKAPSRQQR